MSFTFSGGKARADYGKAERAARELTAAYTSPPIPALEIAEQSGVDVEFASFSGYNDTVAGFCDFAERKLYVNSSDRTTRQNFTIAHELGHWVLHRPLYQADPGRYRALPRFQSVDKKDPLEQEANCFAANLLVPGRLIRPVRYGEVSELADIFGVSREMMEFRLKNVR